MATATKALRVTPRRIPALRLACAGGGDLNVRQLLHRAQVCVGHLVRENTRPVHVDRRIGNVNVDDVLVSILLSGRAAQRATATIAAASRS